jgi:citrate lyase gamma subunit
MTTNATLIEQNKGNYTINYVSNQRQDQFIQQTIHFIPQNTEIDSHSSSSSLKRQTEDTLNYTGYRGKGVLETICQGIYTVVNQNLSHNIIATVAIQSLKKTQKGNDTLTHLRKIFKDVYNSRTGKPIPEKMKEFSGKIKHLIFMIDEITGDEGGVEFLAGISKIIKDYDLTNKEYGFNIKIIVADASIIDEKVIQQHLLQTSPEPNKIFFRKGKIEPTSLSLQRFTFKHHPAVVINANSYPAKTLTLTYKILVQSAPLQNKEILKVQSDLEKRIQTDILNDILNLLYQPTVSQIIVYIQDKHRLYELIQKIQDKLDKFEKYNDYIEIHASLGEQEKKEIHKTKDQVKVIFMTASASRGLSFPKVKHILVDIPHFEIEKNLMEIIQVIYRGRGYYDKGKTFDQDDKELIFYLSEKIIQYEEDTTLQQGILNIINLLLILKTSIMTRILGQGKIGRESVMMIPIGGKSIYTAGQTFSGVISHLIKQLKQELMKFPDKQNFKDVSTMLEDLLQSATFMVTNLSDNNDTSYLKLQESFNNEFLENVNQSFAKLLDYSTIQQSYIQGSLLLIPLENQSIEETYCLEFQKTLSSLAGHKILNNLLQIQYDEQAPNSLRLATKDAIKLIDLLQEKPTKTQKFEQQSQYDDQYYLLPLFIFICEKSLKKHFENKNSEPEDMNFRDILKAYIRLIYPVMNLLPIGDNYQEFPFLLFRSYSLKELRTKIFTDRYFLTSNDLNILNLMLFKD